ncbi:Fic family protein [Bordetella bronchiseptica]|uniref:Fic family protein n=1 Tax=Bordetella bronchiseptica TaxID=518 RepID=UPI003F749018
MKFEEFRAGALRQQYQYMSFEPELVNHQWSWDDPAITTLLERATQALGELNAFSLIVPEIDLFIRMHVIKEAQKSSRIEGTQTGMDEALMSEDQIQPEKRDDWREVRNYIDALNSAIADLTNLPLSNRMLRDAHRILMQGVRGEHKQPGEFRISQNWIGGSSLTDAVFIPAHPTGVADLMGDLELFWHNEEIHVPHLIRAAISHYQFETIHPFLDGNGRIGRLLITLYLVSHGILSKPSLYLSDFFERNRAAYYDALMRVRTSNDLSHWVKFFLNGIAETATKGRDTFQKILALRNEAEGAVMTLGRRSANAREALHALYRRPVISGPDLQEEIGVSAPTVNAVIGDLIKLDILTEITGRQRSRLYSFNRYFKLFLE